MSKTYLSKRQQATLMVLYGLQKKDVYNAAKAGDTERMLACIDSYEALLMTALAMPCIGDKVWCETYEDLDLKGVNCHKE